jgi:HlyD family secretion protein
MNRFTTLAVIAIIAAGGSCARGDGALFATGVFEATEVIISSEATGRLLELSVTEGQDVAAGDIVAKLDCRQLELQRQEIATRVGGLKTRVTDVPTQTAAIAEQLASAERERQRVATLQAAGVATQKQVDDVEAQVALLRRQQAATMQSLTTGNRVLQDERAAMEAQLALVNDQIDRCELKAPVSGTVLVKYAQQGEFTAPGKALFKLADMKNMVLRAYVTADQLTQVKLGQAVKVRADFGADGSREYDGRIAWISTKSEFTPKTIQTRDERANQVYAVKVAVTNDGFLKLGMYGSIPLGADHAGNPGAGPR